MSIRLASRVQAALFECELKGQFSDGKWENANPHNHWKAICAATVVIDPVNPGLDFLPSRRYNCASADLVDIVGDRMLMYARMAIKYPDLSFKAMRNIDSGKWIWDPAEPSYPHYAAFREEVAKYGIVSHETSVAFRAELDHEPYSLKDLRKDLRFITQLISKAYG